MKKKNSKFKLVIASGKGGVGKSMLTSALAMLFAETKKVVAVDCDVDAPNLAIWLNEVGSWKKIIPVIASAKPKIDYRKCNGCGLCVENCRFGALKMKKGKPKLSPFLCEGCGTCEVICPRGAIKLKPVQNGEIKIKKTKYDFLLVLGQLFPGETGSGKIVDQIKSKAEKNKADLMIIDSSPGTGCPVIAALRDANFVILITEPTPSGFSDLKRVLQVVDYFGIPYGVVINKWDINPRLSRKIEKWILGKPSRRISTGFSERKPIIAKRVEISLLGKISYDQNIFKAIANFQPIMETDLKVKEEIKKVYANLNKVFNF